MASAGLPPPVRLVGPIEGKERLVSLSAQRETSEPGPRIVATDQGRLMPPRPRQGGGMAAIEVMDLAKS